MSHNFIKLNNMNHITRIYWLIQSNFEGLLPPVFQLRFYVQLADLFFILNKDFGIINLHKRQKHAVNAKLSVSYRD